LEGWRLVSGLVEPWEGIGFVGVALGGHRRLTCQRPGKQMSRQNDIVADAATRKELVSSN
jgi:hypothetical protein